MLNLFEKFKKKCSQSEHEHSKKLLEGTLNENKTTHAFTYNIPKTVSLRKCVTPTIMEEYRLFDLKESFAISYSGFAKKSVQFLLHLDKEKPVTRREIMQHEKTNELADDFRITTNLSENEVQGLKRIVERTGTKYSAVIRYAISRNL